MPPTTEPFPRREDVQEKRNSDSLSRTVSESRVMLPKSVHRFAVGKEWEALKKRRKHRPAFRIGRHQVGEGLASDAPTHSSGPSHGGGSVNAGLTEEKLSTTLDVVANRSPPVNLA